MNMAFRIETSLDVPATPREVWAVLTDFASYPEWNPFITVADGNWEEGSRVNVTAGGMKFSPEVLRFTPNEELRWKGKLLMPGIFDGEHYFLLSDGPDGTTHLRHGEIFTGVLTLVTKSLLYEKTKAGFVTMNEALARRVVSRSAKV